MNGLRTGSPGLVVPARPGPRRSRSGRFSLLVDARSLGVAGLGRYVREVVLGVLRDPRFVSLRLLGDVDLLRDFAAVEGVADRVAIVPFPTGFYRATSQLAWLRLHRAGLTTCDAALFPHYDAPFFALPPRSAVAVQDLTHFRLREVFPAAKRLPAAILLRRVVRRAARILVSAEATRRDLLERWPAAATKTVTIPLGVGEFFRVPEEDAAQRRALRRARGEPPYLLCVGNRKPHKNLTAAVETLAILRRDDARLRLVLAGREFAGCQALDRARSLGVRDAVDLVDSADDAGLRDLYVGADALLFPSLYEGFGLPALEAMGCGAPVIAADRGGLREVVDRAGVLVHPHDHGAMAAAVRRLRTDPDWRARLIARGRARAAELTWARATGRTADVLAELAAGQAAPPTLVRSQDEEL